MRPLGGLPSGQLPPPQVPEGVNPEGDFVSVLSLGANQGSVIEIAAEGIDAEAALDALLSLVENNFSLQEKQPDNSSQTNKYGSFQLFLNSKKGNSDVRKYSKARPGSKIQGSE